MKKTRISDVDMKTRMEMGIAILPGLWMVIWYMRVAGVIPIKIGTIVLILLSVGVGGAFCVKYRELSTLSLPALGALLWLGTRWMHLGWRHLERWILLPLARIFQDGLYMLFNIGSFWLVQGIVAFFICAIAVWIYFKSRLQLQRLEYLGLGVLVVITLSHAAILYVFLATFLMSTVWPLFFLPMLISFVCLFLITICGLWLARLNMLKASLLVKICEPIWIAWILRPLQAWEFYFFRALDSHLTLGSLVLLALPALSFMVIIPLGLLGSRSKARQIRWLILPSALTLGIIQVLDAIMSQSTVAEMPLNAWQLKSLLALQIWVPMLIVAGSLSTQANMHLESTAEEYKVSA
jgi:hypothetical protein